MSPNPARSTQLSLAQQEELKKMTRRMLLRDPLLALKLRTGNGRDVLAIAEQFARKYGVPVSIVAAAIGVFATGFAAAKVLDENDLWVPEGSGAGRCYPSGLSLQAFWGSGQ